jgi:UDP-glucose:(heptosyl)LPS alpha-1,3-glucosyltransferase
MKIAVIKANASHPGGLEKQAKKIIEGFIQAGMDVKLPSIPPLHGPNFLRLKRFNRKATEWIDQEKPDIIFGMDRTDNITHLRAGNGVHAAYLKIRRQHEGLIKHWICQINPLHRTILDLEKKGFESPQLRTLFVNSEMVKKEASEHYQIDPRKIEVLHNGVEWDEMEEPFNSWPKQKESLLKQYKLPQDAIHLLFAGSGFQRKGLDLLLRALHLANLPHLHLSIVGKDKNSDHYQALVHQLKLQSQVTFFGLQPSLIPFYQYSDILCIPSLYDPFANVTVEGLAMGLFVITSKQNGGHEIVKPGAGLILDLNTIETWADALRLFAASKEEKKGTWIRQTVAHLTFTCQLQKLIQITCKI